MSFKDGERSYQPRNAVSSRKWKKQRNDCLLALPEEVQHCRHLGSSLVKPISNFTHSSQAVKQTFTNLKNRNHIYYMLKLQWN